MKQPTSSLLFVEDDAIVRDIICSFIAARYPFLTIDAAGSAEEGVALFESRRHDVVVTDVNLVDLDGVSLARAIRKKAPKTVVVFVTGSSDIEPLAEFGKDGLGHIIIKPVECDALFRILDTCITSA